MDLPDLYEKGMEKAGLPQMGFENLMIAGLIASGSVLLFPFQLGAIPVMTIVYLAFVVTMLGFVLRKHLCSSCWYYGKSCHCGWGRLSARLFKQNSGNYKLGGTLGNLTWMVIMILPLFVFVIGLLTSSVRFAEKWPVLAFFLGFVVINGGLHKKSCTECKMRFICPGSAAKKKTV